MSLPGGINVDGELRRDFCFRPVTGELELFLGESAQQANSHPERVTVLLSQALDTIGGVSASMEVVRRLSVGDRQFLMSQLATHIDNQLVWVTTHCAVCEESFDVSYRQSDLPVKKASKDFPQAVVNTSLGDVTVRVPTGADQELVAAAGDDAKALRVLLKCIVVDAPSDVDQLNTEDITAIEKRVEAMAPEIATELLARCPNCHAENTLELNPYTSLQHWSDKLFTEVHTIASQYHWSEQEILALRRDRRQNYLRLIDQGRGMQDRVDKFQTLVQETWD